MLSFATQPSRAGSDDRQVSQLSSGLFIPTLRALRLGVRSLPDVAGAPGAGWGAVSLAQGGEGGQDDSRSRAGESWGGS